MITIEQLNKTYGKNAPALRSINLKIGEGMFGLVGPNGAGKTTLMRILAGVIQPTKGRVSVLGADLLTEQGKDHVKRNLGYLPQALGLYPQLTGREFLNYVAILKGVTRGATRAAQVEELLELVRLTDVANRPLKTYSGGMKQRIGIAQALLGSPKLLIVDEPTAGLDPEERVRFRNLLSSMASRCTVILSTHIIEDISHSCNDLAIIRKGEVLFQGSPASLMNLVRGNVWTITSHDPLPEVGLYTMSTIQTASGVQYRVLGNPPASLGAVPAEPTLEDAYLWKMNVLESV